MALPGKQVLSQELLSLQPQSLSRDCGFSTPRFPLTKAGNSSQPFSPLMWEREMAQVPPCVCPRTSLEAGTLCKAGTSTRQQGQPSPQMPLPALSSAVRRGMIFR